MTMTMTPEASQMDGFGFFVIAWSRISVIGVFVQKNSLNLRDHVIACLEHFFGFFCVVITVIGVIDVIMRLA